MTFVWRQIWFAKDVCCYVCGTSAQCAHVSDKFIDFPLMHSYGMEVLCGLTASCSMMFSHVAVRQLTDRNRADWWSEFFQALDGAKGRAGEDLLCCRLRVILHLLTHVSLRVRSISACVDNMCACTSKCVCVSLVDFWRRGWEVKSYSAQGCSQSH